MIANQEIGMRYCKIGMRLEVLSTGQYPLTNRKKFASKSPTYGISEPNTEHLKQMTKLVGKRRPASFVRKASLSSLQAIY